MSLIPGVLVFCVEMFPVFGHSSVWNTSVRSGSLVLELESSQEGIKTNKRVAVSLKILYKIHILDRNSCPGHLPWVSDGCPNLQPPGPPAAAALAAVQCDAEVFCLFCFLLHRPWGTCGYRIIISCLLKKRNTNTSHAHWAAACCCPGYFSSCYLITLLFPLSQKVFLSYLTLSVSVTVLNLY